MARIGKALVLSFLLVAFFAGGAQAATRTFPCKNNPADDLLPKVRALLSKEGRAVIDEGTNSIIVSDSPAVLRDVAGLLERIDAPAPVVRLRVQRIAPSILEGTGVSVDWRHIDGNWRVGDLSGASVGDRRYEASGKTVILHGSADAGERAYKTTAGRTVQVALGGRVRADRLRGGLFRGCPFVHDLEAAEAQAVLLITPAVSEKKVFLTVVPATLLFRKGKATVHPLEELKVTAWCPRTGQVLLGTGNVKGGGLLSGFLDGFDGAGGGTPGGFSLLIRVDVEPSP